MEIKIWRINSEFSHAYFCLIFNYSKVSFLYSLLYAFTQCYFLSISIYNDFVVNVPLNNKLHSDSQQKCINDTQYRGIFTPTIEQLGMPILMHNTFDANFNIYIFCISYQWSFINICQFAYSPTVITWLWMDIRRKPLFVVLL